MAELAELASSAGVVVQDTIIQRRSAIDPRTVLGKGKLDELIIRALQLGADMLVFDSDLSPAQVRSLSETTDLKIIDRSQLILDIFAQRAQSKEGKIQVELAQLKYLLPRLIAGQDSAFSRLAGGIGGRGPGETKLETDRRRVRDRINRLERAIEEQRQRRQERRKARTRQALPVISIVGYTNAGKSTLFNALSKAEVLVSSRMFATLDPTIRALRLPSGRRVLLSDTVGFIRDLPKGLMTAFRATLEEVQEAAVILHVSDISSPRHQELDAAVKKILAELGVAGRTTLRVWNKMDLLSTEEKQDLRKGIAAADDGATPPALVSAATAEGLESLLVRIDEALPVDPIVKLSLRLPLTEGRTLALVHALGKVVHSEVEDIHMLLDCEVPASLARRLKLQDFAFHGTSVARLASD